MRNLKVKYRRSVLGFFWTLLIPISQSSIYYLVFLKILKVQIEHYVPFILSGVMFWTFFSNTLNEGMESLLNNSSLLTKIPVPLQTFPLVAALSHGINLGLAIPVVAGAMALDGLPLRPAFLMMPLLLGAILVISYSISLVFSLVMVFFRDLRYVLALLLQVWMYGTPVLYNEQMVPESFRWILWANPIGLIFPSIHDVVLRGVIPEFATLGGILGWTIASVLGAQWALKYSLRKGVIEWL
jgi:ABC-2 type transport system permease protein